MLANYGSRGRLALVELLLGLVAQLKRTLRAMAGWAKVGLGSLPGSAAGPVPPCSASLGKSVNVIGGCVKIRPECALIGKDPFPALNFKYRTWKAIEGCSVGGYWNSFMLLHMRMAVRLVGGGLPWICKMRRGLRRSRLGGLWGGLWEVLDQRPPAAPAPGATPAPASAPPPLPVPASKLSATPIYYNKGNYEGNVSTE